MKAALLLEIIRNVSPGVRLPSNRFLPLEGMDNLKRPFRKDIDFFLVKSVLKSLLNASTHTQNAPVAVMKKIPNRFHP